MKIDHYSFVSNKHAGGNKRAGWIFSGILIIVQGGNDSSDVLRMKKYPENMSNVIDV